MDASQRKHNGIVDANHHHDPPPNHHPLGLRGIRRGGASCEQDHRGSWAVVTTTTTSGTRRSWVLVIVSVGLVLWNNAHVLLSPICQPPDKNVLVPKITLPTMTMNSTTAQADDKSLWNYHHAAKEDSKTTKRSSSGAASSRSSPPFVIHGDNHKCHYVEDICHMSHQWFYRSTPSSPSQHQQPSLVLNMHSKRSREQHDDDESVHMHSYHFQPPSNNETTMAHDEAHCVYSPITNHLVLYSAYNDMLGEFYDRSLVFLHQLSLQNDWVASVQTQLYLHLYQPYMPLLDSHHLFTSVVRKHPLQSFVSMLEEPFCTCVPRLIFCGYTVHAQQQLHDNETTTFDTHRTATELGSTNASSSSTNVTVVLEPGGGMGYGDPRPPGTTTWYRALRNHLRHELIAKKPYIQRDIQLYRQRILEQHGVPSSQHHQWKVIGLTQRVKRRSWKKLSSTLSQTQQALNTTQSKILLLEINVELNSSPYQQLIRHSALNGLIGIHGAQLTEAIWMPNHSWIIELLPYIPPGIHGGLWTTDKTNPTPLGRIFDNTELNHVGYPLERDSAPYCWEQDTNVTCWKQHRWSKRDYVVISTLLELIIRSTVLSEELLAQSCYNYLRQVTTMDSKFVLYNITCREKLNQPLTPHHYYWNETNDKIPIEKM